MSKNRNNLPPHFNPKYLLAIIGLRYEETTEDKKFTYLKNKDLDKLIRPAIYPEFLRKRSALKRSQERLNGKLKQIAELLSVNDLFVEDILRMAKKYSLLNSR